MDARDAKYIRLTTEPVEKLVCAFAVPSIVSMMISSIYNIVDTFFVGRLDTQSTAALGVVFAYMTIMQAISFYFGHGSGNYISRALGAREPEKAGEMAATGFLTAIGLGIAVACVCFAFTKPVLRLFGATETVLPCAVSYFRWILVGTPFIVGTFVLNNQMRLQGNAKLGMYGILSGAILNMALDPLFIFGLKMGVAGAGLATAISQCCSFCVILAISGWNGGIRISPRNFKPSARLYREVNSGGLPSLVRQGLMSVTTLVLNNCAGVYGDEALAAFSIIGRVTHLACAIILGFGQGFQPVCGFNLGARRFDRLSKALKFCITLSTAYCFVIAFAGFIFAPGIIRIFRAEDAEVVRLGALILRANCLTFPLIGLIMMSNMYLQTTNQTTPAVVLAFARNGMFLIPVIAIGAALFGFDGLVASQPISDVLSFALALPLIYRARPSRLKEKTEAKQ